MADSAKKKPSARQIATTESPSKKAAKKAKVSKTTVNVFEPVTQNSFTVVEIEDPKSLVMLALKQERKTAQVKTSKAAEKEDLSAMFASFSKQMRCMFSAELQSASAHCSPSSQERKKHDCGPIA